MARIVGKDAALYLNISGTWNFVADLFDWSFDYESVTFDASIKGDLSERPVVSHGRGRLSAKRYVEAVAAFSLADLVTTAARYDWAVVSVDTVPPAPSGFSTNANAKIQGTGYVVRAQAHAPQSLVEDSFELLLDTVPVIQ